MEDYKDEKKILSEGEQLANLVKGDGWMIVKQRLITKMLDLSNILAYDNADYLGDPAKLVLEISANQQAVKILMEWLQDIEGTVQQRESYAEQFKDIQKQGFIEYFDQRQEF